MAWDAVRIEHLVEFTVRGESRWTGRVDLPRGGGRVSLLVLAVDGQWLAVRDGCPHNGASLLRGRLSPEKGILECPSHGWELALSGEELQGRPVEQREDGFYLLIEAPRSLGKTTPASAV